MTLADILLLLVLSGLIMAARKAERGTAKMPKPRSPHAKALGDQRYRPRVVKPTPKHEPSVDDYYDELEEDHEVHRIGTDQYRNFWEAIGQGRLF